jgi:rhodanese-related sulfurtransferase
MPATQRPTAGAPIRRTPRRDDAFMVPRAVPGEPGRFVVDATWGTITPIAIAPGVRTVGEREVIAHIAADLPLLDTRLEGGTLPTARFIPHTELAARARELDRTTDTIVFCNGPQCGATPDAIATLLAAGHPPERLLYYRGGIHDWVTLGLPLEPLSEPSPTSSTELLASALHRVGPRAGSDPGIKLSATEPNSAQLERL